MPYPSVFFWKKIPVIRLLIPFFLGIAQQYYWPAPVSVLQGVALVSTGLIGYYSIPLLPFYSRFRSGFINGLSVFLLFVALGAISVWQQDIRKGSLWPGNIEKVSDALIIKLLEKPSEKQKTFKARGILISMLHNSQQTHSETGIHVYLQKDSSSGQLAAGDVLLTTARLQTIPPAAAPGQFDYQQYSFLQGITHQVFLRNDFVIVAHDEKGIDLFINKLENWVLRVLRNAFPDKKERGLAEALLIGYRDELDKSLVQSYTNTGVVHIIAISGLHLGLIYWLLVKLLQPLSGSRRLKWLNPVLIVCGLWIFTLLAGAQPSVLRSAIMFTCIVAGNCFSRQTNVFNSLAVSAFILLCYNPYWLWDAGFQLSYAAIIGIVIFMKPIYQLTTFQNKLVDTIWQMNAVTLSAQLLTLPVCIYHFHQFPNYFLLSNIIAVPLSSLILLLEILLCVVSFCQPVFSITAALTGYLIRFMNTCIAKVEQLPFAVWDGLQINFLQSVLLYVFIICLICCLIYRKYIRMLTYCSLLALTTFAGIRYLSFADAYRQHKIIIYREASDFIWGRRYASFASTVTADENLLLPTRNYLRLRERDPSLITRVGARVSFLSKRIILLNDTDTPFFASGRAEIDLMVLSHNPGLKLNDLLQAMSIRQVVADGTVPFRTMLRWQQECEHLGIPFHDVRAKGAFVMNF